MHSVAVQFQNISFRIIPLVVFVCVILYFSYRGKSSKTNIGRLLLLLRIVAIGSILILITKPIIRWTKDKVRKPRVAIFIDNSKSITAQNGVEADSVRSVIRHLVRTLERRKADVKIIPFGLDIGGEINRLSDIKFDQNGTDISKVLNFCSNNAGKIPIDAGIVISDGVSNSGEEPTMLKSFPPFPIYTIGIGDSATVMDPAVIELTMPSISRSGDSVSVEARVKPFGYSGTTTISLRQDGLVVQRKKIPLIQQSLTEKVGFTIVPEEPGIHTYTVSIDTSQDRNPLNNARSTLMRVYNDKIRFIIIQGRNNFESRFFKSILASIPEVEVITATAYNNRWYHLSDTDPFKLSWDALALFGFPGESVNTEQIKKLQSKIITDRPALFVQLSGVVNIEQLNGLFPDPPLVSYQPSNAGILSVETRIAENQSRHPVLMNLLAEKNLNSDWANLPPVGMPFQNIELSPDFLTIVETADKNALPILSLSQSFGNRRALLCGLDLWRWDMMTTEGDNHYIYKKLMVSIAKWLTDTLSTSNLQFSPDKDIYLKGEIATVRGVVTDVTGKVIPNAVINASLYDSGNNILDFLIQWNGIEYQGKVPLTKEGEYRITISAKAGDFDLGEYHQDVRVLPNSVEFQQIKQDIAVLKGIANRTGGTYSNLDHYESITDRIDLRPEKIEQSFRKKLWQWPGIFILLLLALTVEWVVRRRSGYQ